MWKDHKKYPRDIKDVLISEFVEKLKIVADGMYFDEMMLLIKEYEAKLK